MIRHCSKYHLTRAMWQLLIEYQKYKMNLDTFEMTLAIGYNGYILYQTILHSTEKPRKSILSAALILPLSERINGLDNFLNKMSELTIWF